MKHICIALFFIVCSAAEASTSAFTIPRTWSNPQGDKITGTLLSYQNGNVILKRSDGMIFSIPLSSLSERDQGYMESLVTNSSGKGYVLNRKYDVQYTVARLYTTGGDLVETEKEIGLGDKEKVRTPKNYYAVLQGITSKYGYVYNLSKESYNDLNELQKINVNKLNSYGFLDSNRITDEDSPINMSGALVLQAKYGADGEYNDVTSIIQKSINNGEKSIRVGNNTMGGDPIFGTPKKLELILSTPTGTVQKTVREGNTLKLR